MQSYTDTQRRLTAFLAAMAFFLSTVEYLIPRPLPFLRLGLANIPLLLAVDMLGLPAYFLLLVLKVLGMNLLSGALFSYIALFSLLGTLASGLVMRGLRRLGGQGLSYVGLSVAGALASNGAQLLAARYLVFGPAAFYMLPLVAGFGLISGLLLGLFCNLFVRQSHWFDGCFRPLQAAALAGSPGLLKERRSKAGTGSWWSDADLRRQWWLGRFAALPTALVGLGLIAASLLLPGIYAKLSLFMLALVLYWLSGRRLRPVNILILMGGIVFAHLLMPSGRILLRLGPLLVSQDALLKGVQKALVFESIILFSRASISPRLRLPGRFGGFFSAAMTYYERFLAAGQSIRPRSFLSDVDRILCSVYQSRPPN